MDDFTVSLCMGIAVLFLLFGYATGKSDVATDCEKVGSFYRADKVYTCEVKK